MVRTNDYKITEETTFSAKGKNAIYFQGTDKGKIDEKSFKIENGNLTFTADGITYTVSDYQGIRYIKTDKTDGEKTTQELTDIISNNYVSNVVVYDEKRHGAAGTQYNDTIDLSGVTEPVREIKNRAGEVTARIGVTVDGGVGNDTIIGTNYNDTLRGGVDDDTITGGLGDDTITGGVGTNIINYTKGDGNDVINLTKGENFTLQLNGITDVSELKFEYANRNRDLRIYTDKNSTDEYITIKNFGAKDVTNNATRKSKDTSSVELKVGDSDAVDLKKYVYTTTTDKNFTGTWLNDSIDASEMTTPVKTVKNRKGEVTAEIGVTLKGENGDDTVTGSKFNDTINGGNGDDVISAGAGNDTITGGRGENTINYTSGNDTIYLTKGESLKLNLDNVTITDVAQGTGRGKNDLVLTTDEGTITLKNYYAKDTGATVNIKDATMTDYQDFAKVVKFAAVDKTYFQPEGARVRTSYTGSALADEIDASEVYLTKTTGRGKNRQTVELAAKDRGLTLRGGNGDDVITGSKYSDTIQGGVGDDTINGSLGNDKIAGGVGHNTVKYDDIDKIDGDKIYLTKGENLTIDMSEIGLGEDNITYTVKGRDLVISVTDGDNTKSLTLVNFGTKDVTNTATRKNGYTDTSSVELKLADTSDTLDLREIIVNSANGTWHNDYINRDDYVNNRNRGLSLNGGTGNDTIIGTRYADNIKGGDGDDIIYGGFGNDTLSGGKGADTFAFDTFTRDNDYTGLSYYGSGKDVITDVESADTLRFATSHVEDFKFEKAKNGRDLVITYYDKDDKNRTKTVDNTVTVRNYFDRKTGKALDNRNFSIAALDENGNVKTYQSEDIIAVDDNGNVGMNETFRNTVSDARNVAEDNAAAQDERNNEAINNYYALVEKVGDINRQIEPNTTATSVDDLQGRVTGLQNNITTLNGQITALNGTVSTLTTDRDNYKSQYETADASLKELQKQVKDLNTQIESTTDKYTISDLKDKVTGLQEQIENLTTQRDGYKTDLDKANTDLTNAQTALTNKTNEYDTLVSKISDLNKAIDGNTGDITDLSNKVTDLNTRMSDLQKQLGSVVSYKQGTMNNDTITGTTLKEVFDTFSGDDIITDAHADDKVRIGDKFSNMMFGKSTDGNDLVIYYNDNHDSVSLKNWFSDTDNRVDTLIDSTGKEHTISTEADYTNKFFGVQNADSIRTADLPVVNTINAVSGTNNLYVNGSADVVTGGTGADTMYVNGSANDIVGGKGNDNVYLNKSSDKTVINFAKGDGDDTVYAGGTLGGSDAVLNFTDTDVSKLIFSVVDKTDKNASLKIDTGEGSVTIKDWYNYVNTIDTIKDSTGATYKISELDAVKNLETSKEDYYVYGRQTYNYFYIDNGISSHEYGYVISPGSTIVFTGNSMYCIYSGYDWYKGSYGDGSEAVLYFKDAKLSDLSYEFEYDSRGNGDTTGLKINTGTGSVSLYEWFCADNSAINTIMEKI